MTGSNSRIIDFIKEVWDYPRSLTGWGTRQTLKYLQHCHSDLQMLSYFSGQQIFDWTIPDEWNIEDAFLEHESGKRFCELHKSNLHVVGYSVPGQYELNKEELLDHIYTRPDRPDWIPYVTSYYEDHWGFCMSENEKSILPEGKYVASIRATKGPGELNVGELIITGKKQQEIMFSTNICHPSMANNELSGPALSSALISYINKSYPLTNYSYRFLFVPETIGSLAYMSDHLDELQNNLLAGFTLSCVGDERGYSYIPSRLGNTLADQALLSSLEQLPDTVVYSFLDRGSDERQYCAPGIDLPVCGFAKSKYGEYPEYHTSADNLDVVTEEGLQESFNVIKNIVDAFEMGLYPRATVKGEPQLGIRGLYPNISQKKQGSEVKTMMNVLSYSDGNHSLFDISLLIKQNLFYVIKEVTALTEHGLLEYGYRCVNPNEPKRNPK